MSKKVNVIFLSRSYYPNIGGVEKHIYEISKQLVKDGFKVTIITEDVINSLSQLYNNNFEINEVNIIRIPVGKQNWFKKFRIWKWIWRNRALFIKTDIIHCHDVFFWYLPLALLHPLKPVYTTFHGYESYPIKTKDILYRKIFEYMSNRTICVGDFMKKWYHANPTTVIYGGATVLKSSVRPQKNSAVFIGRLDEHTGINLYVDAVKLIRKKIPDFTLTVYGDGPYQQKIHTEGIILKGENVNADKEISRFEYAFVSRYLVILEAMAAKRPVFAVYDNPVKKDYLLMTPYKDWITVSANAKDLADKVIRYSKNNTNNIFVDKSYKWIQTQTWNKIEEDYIKLWGVRKNII